MFTCELKQPLIWRWKGPITGVNVALLKAQNFQFYHRADADKALGRLVTYFDGSLKINQSAASVFDHFGNGPDRFGFCCLMIGAYLALIISKDAVTLYDVEMEPGHLI
jgi:hypothetical protein